VSEEGHANNAFLPQTSNKKRWRSGFHADRITGRHFGFSDPGGVVVASLGWGENESAASQMLNRLLKNGKIFEHVFDRCV